MYRQTALATLSFYLRRFPWHSGRWRLIPLALDWCCRDCKSSEWKVVLTRHGFRQRIDRSEWLGRHIYVTGEYEPATTRLFKQLLRPGDVVVDIGANAGYFTLLSAMRVGEAGKVISFEPIPGVRRQLEENIELNRLRNCVVRGEAIFNMDGSRSFFQGPTDHLGVSSLRNLDDCSSVFTVASARLDDVLANEPKISLIKIDIEGAECHALEGMMRCLERHRPAVIVEITEEYLQEMDRSPGDLYGIFASLDYQGYLIADEGLIPLDRRSKQPRQFNALFSGQHIECIHVV
jgi:FkbM family methyltransferase